ncbi:MAG: DUF934 domain-containing protein [Pontibacterium sp.]
MPLFINRTLVENDSWQQVDEESLTQGGDIIVPLPLYQAHLATLQSREGQVAIQIEGDVDINWLLAHAEQFPLITIHFPVLRDGRGFSIARLLRRAGFSGEIRALGDVSQDRLDFMTRCGFDALEIPTERFSPEVANAFDEFSVRYQGAADHSRPVYHQ